ncbi:hypothetical protein BDQ17DRAFT_1367266 [Cyathus striatus]|nr:hypothetical protein BDQ17DRAFT_1367266 [Cyathus striatus]
MSQPSKHTSILSFPVELLQNITQLSLSCQALRLVCREFHDVVTPQIFSSVYFLYGRRNLNDFLEVLELLAVRQPTFMANAKSLTIGNLKPYPYTIDDDGTWEECQRQYKGKQRYKLEVLDPYYAHSQSIEEWLPLAISNFKQVTTVKWTINDRKLDDWSRDCAIAGIAGMPSLTRDCSLTAFELMTRQYNYGFYIRLDSLPPLQTLSISVGPSTLIDEAIQGIPELIAKSSLYARQASHWSRHNQYTPSLNSFLPNSSPLRITHLNLGGFDLKLNKTVIPHLRSLESICLMESAKSYDSDWSQYSSEENLKSFFANPQKALWVI